MRSYTEIAILDEKTLVTLAADTSADLVPVVVNMFIDETKVRIPKILQAWDTKDYVSLENEIHAMKSGAGSFGLQRLYHIAVDLHEYVRDHNDEKIAVMAAYVESVWDESLKAITMYLESTNPGT